jgi:hypothetical protein
MFEHIHFNLIFWALHFFIATSLYKVLNVVSTSNEQLCLWCIDNYITLHSDQYTFSFNNYDFNYDELDHKPTNLMVHNFKMLLKLMIMKILYIIFLWVKIFILQLFSKINILKNKKILILYWGCPWDANISKGIISTNSKINFFTQIYNFASNFCNFLFKVVHLFCQRLHVWDGYVHSKWF